MRCVIIINRSSPWGKGFRVSLYLYSTRNSLKGAFVPFCEKKIIIIFSPRNIVHSELMLNLYWMRMRGQRRSNAVFLSVHDTAHGCIFCKIIIRRMEPQNTGVETSGETILILLGHFNRRTKKTGFRDHQICLERWFFPLRERSVSYRLVHVPRKDHESIR